MKFLVIFLLLLLPLFAQVGKISYVKGSVSIQRDGALKPAVAGMELKQKDMIITEKASLAKLLFKDNTSISVGAKSDFSIEKYFFDEQKDSVAKFKVNKGIFRAITGKIAKISPNNFKLKTKTATMGIRGTIFSAVIEDDKEEFFCEKGAIYVISQGISIDIAKGFKSQVIPGRAPTAPARYQPQELKAIQIQVSGWKGKKCN